MLNNFCQKVVFTVTVVPTHWVLLATGVTVPAAEVKHLHLTALATCDSSREGLLLSYFSMGELRLKKVESSAC